MLMIYDPDILKQIMIGDFSNFTNRMVCTNVFYPLYTSNLLCDVIHSI